MTRMPLLALVLVALALAACEPAEFDHPLTDPALAGTDSSLFGAWIAEGRNDVEILCISPSKGGGMQVVLTGPNDAVPGGLTFRGHASRVGPGSYLNLRALVALDFRGRPLEEKDRRERATFSERWWILAYRFTADSRLVLSYFDDAKAGSLIRAGRLEGVIGRGGEGTRVTSGTAALARVLPTLDPGECFERYAVLRRIVVPPSDTTGT